MSLQDNKAIVDRVYLEMFNEGNLEVADELLTRDHVIHIPPLPWDQVGLDTMKYLIALFRRISPDIHVAVDDSVAEGDKVVTSWTARGTVAAEMRGDDPDDNEVRASGVSIHRIVDGQIGETWWRFEARLHEESQQSIREGNREFLLHGKPLEVDQIVCAGICHVLRGCHHC
jgi:predicted SnoaL-like aldol condensation-catalyzing enzyme